MFLFEAGYRCLNDEYYEFNRLFISQNFWIWWSYTTPLKLWRKIKIIYFQNTLYYFGIIYYERAKDIKIDYHLVKNINLKLSKQLTFHLWRRYIFELYSPCGKFVICINLLIRSNLNFKRFNKFSKFSAQHHFLLQRYIYAFW